MKLASLLRRQSAQMLLGLAGLLLPAAVSGQTVLSGVYNAQVLVGDFTMAPSTSATFTGGTSITGGTATLATSSGIYWQQVGTIAGMDFTLASGAYLYVSQANSALTLGPDVTVSGSSNVYSDGSVGTAITNQGTILHTTGSGSLYARSFTNEGQITATGGSTLYFGYPSAGYDSVNTATGTITADGATVYLRGNVDNNGLVRAQNAGVLLWDGANTTANLGTVELLSGGRALLNGTLDNSAATLTAPTGGVFELYGGTIQGGTIAAGALGFTSSGGYLDGAIFTGDLVFPTGTYARFVNGASFTGVSVTLGASAGIYWQQAGTFSGNTLSFGSGSYIYVTGAGSTLTLDSETSASGTVSLYTDGGIGRNITQQGTISHTGGTGSLYADLFTNEGQITATGGSTLYFGYPSAGYDSVNTASGTITADGATVYLRGNVDNDGLVRAQNAGVLLWDGANTTANLGSIELLSGGRALLNGTLDNSAATLTAPTGGVFELYGGTIQGGTIAAGALGFTSSGGYLDGTIFTGDLVLPANTHARFVNGASFTGVNVTLGASAGIYWQQTGGLSGNTLSFGSGSYIYVFGAGSTLSLDSETSASGTVSLYTDGGTGRNITQQGTISHTGGTGSLYAGLFTNEGQITATGGSTLYFGYPSAGYDSVNTATGTITADGATVYLRGNVDNNGLVRAQNAGVLLWDGANTTANLGTVELLSGGRALLNGTLDNSAATLTAPTGGVFELYGGTIQGGTIAAGALGFTSSGGYLDGAIFTGDLVLPASTHARFINGASFTGNAVTLGNSAVLFWQQSAPLAGINVSLGSGAGIYWQQAGTFSGNTLSFDSGSYIYVSGADGTLTLDSETSASGSVSVYTDGGAGRNVTQQGTISHTGGTGSLYADLFSNEGQITATGGSILYFGYPSAGYDSVNTATGTITADGATVYLRGNVDNNGLVRAQNAGVLLWDGANTTANLGTVELLSGGRALLNGTLDNTLSLLTAPLAGLFELYGGTIQGGTIAAGALGFTSAGGYLDGTIFTGDLVLPANTHVRWVNGASFTGNTVTLGGGATLFWQQSGTLAGDAVTMASGSSLYVVGTDSVLTLDGATTVTGTVNLYSDGSAGTAITNQGTITHTTGVASIYARLFTNEGTINVTAGSVYLSNSSTGFTLTNAAAGGIHLSTGNLYLQGPVTNHGVLSISSGVLYSNGHLTNAATGTIQGAGTINGDVTMTGGTLAPGNSVGTLTFSSGELLVTGPSTLEIEVDGSAADQIVFLSTLASVDIGAGLMNLSVALLSEPALGTPYTIMSTPTNGLAITGTFSGLPLSGGLIEATYLDVTYVGSVNYLGNAITLDFKPVPEPETYVLMGTGLAFLAWRRRRSAPTRKG